MNPLLISPEKLAECGLLERIPPKFRGTGSGKADFRQASEYRKDLFGEAWKRLAVSGLEHEFRHFCSEHAGWLDDYVLFRVIRGKYPGQTWNRWPKKVRDRYPENLETIRRESGDRLLLEKFIQWLTWKQWFELKEYCNSKGIQIIGDMPIYVHYDSADVWSHPGFFKLGLQKEPTHVAGVPPDYFSDTGQLWGNPVYDWDAIAADGFDWWVRRIGLNLHCFDFLRIDHFRGLVAYWEVESGEPNAVNGKWVEVPKDALFGTLRSRLPALPLIAEDLGVITPDVTEFLNRSGFPGMKVLQFGFMSGETDHPYQPHNFPENCVAYTGTHDNNTLKGWYRNELGKEGKKILRDYCGRKINARNVHREMIRLGMMSRARTFVFPMQDVIGLGDRARMNKPATTENNWLWRFVPGQLKKVPAGRLRKMNELYGRTNPLSASS